MCVCGGVFVYRRGGWGEVKGDMMNGMAKV